MWALHYRFLLYSWLHRDKTFRLRADVRKVFVFLAADYGNLGDVSITYAQEKLLRVHYPDCEIVDVPASRTLSLLRPIKQIAKAEDIITIIGGGNMGEMYGDIELLRLMIIRAFPGNKVIVFPQTIDYTGRRCYLFSLAKCIYNKHRNLTLFAREEASYDKMRNLFPKADVRLLPDIAMTLDCRDCSCERDGVMMCMRDDKERSLSWDIEPLISDFERNGYTIRKCDTHIGRGNLSVEEREKELSGIWSAISHSKLIVTDRLHGMIFAFITGTPAIVLPNSNFKIEKSFEWIKQCGYVVFCPQKVSFPEAKSLIENHKNNFEDVFRHINELYDEICSDIK